MSQQLPHSHSSLNEISLGLEAGNPLTPGFNPFIFDASPLQKLLLGLVKEVEACKAENTQLRDELKELKLDSRLSILEANITEFAEMQRSDRGYGEDAAYGPPPTDATESGTPGIDGQANANGHGVSFQNNKGPSDASGTPGLSPRNPSAVDSSSALSEPASNPHAPLHSTSGGAALVMRGPPGQRGHPGKNVGPSDTTWILHEFNILRERLEQMERKSEALWHVQDQDQELRAVVERLRNDVESARFAVHEVQTSTRASHDLVDKLERNANNSGVTLRELKDKVTHVDTQLQRANEEKRDAAAKLENNVNLIWDQIRHVENSLSQRLTLAETSQIGTLQEVDEMKESAGEVMTRVDDVRRHIAALESKLESFNTQVAAAMSPLHSSLTEIKIRLEDLNQSKQDVETAVTLEDVNVAVSRSIDHADRRADNIVKSIGAMEDRVEELNGTKANKCDVVMTTDLESLLTAHATEMDRHLDALKRETLVLIGTKADKEELATLDAKLGARIGSLEAAILKGLKAISDKVTAALAEKLDLLRFNEFKLQVRAILADVEDRLRDWSPISGGIKAPLDGSTGTAGASSCLLCDRRVRSSAEMKQTQPAILTAADRIFAPEKVPESILPSISEKSGSPSAANNAKILSRKKDTAALLNQLSATMPESVPSSPKSQPGTMMGTANLLDMSGLISGNPNRVEVETISGTIAAGKLPTKSAGGASRLKDAKASEADPDPNAISNVIKIGK